MVYLLSPGNCCGVDCTQFTDDFNRSDSTDIGSDWTEVAGDWSIASNELFVSSTNAVCVSVATYDPPYIYYCESPIPELRTANYIVHYTDSSNYWFLQHRRQFGTSHSLRLVEVSGGVEEVRGSDSINGQDGAVKVCVLSNAIHVMHHVGGGVYEPSFFVTSTFPSGAHIGFGTSFFEATSIVFDNCIIETHELDDAACDSCVTPGDNCDGCDIDFDMPAIMQVVISGMANNDPGQECANFNATWLCYQDGDCRWSTGDIDFLSDEPCSDFSEVSVVIDAVNPIGEPGACDKDDVGDAYEVSIRCSGGSSTICTDSGCVASFYDSQVDEYDCSSFNNTNIPRYTISAQTCDNTSATAALTSL